MDQSNEPNLIIGFGRDLYFTSRVDSVAKQLNFRVIWVETAEDIAPDHTPYPGRELGEPLVGQKGALIEQITKWDPVLIICDLNNHEIPWVDWIQVISSVPATRRIPIISFGSHMQVESMQSAKNAGSTLVLSRSRFVAELPNLIKKYARLPDHKGLRTACQKPLDEKGIRGLRKFNHGEYYEAHEYLEEAWMEDKSVGRDLYRAILQLAVAYYQIERGNYNGAMKMFLRIRQWINNLPDVCMGVNVAKLRIDASLAHKKLVELGPDNISKFDRRYFQPVDYREI